MSTIRVLIADDHALFREGLCAMLQLIDGIDVVGEAGTGEDTLASVDQLRPDVVMMDIQMPGLNGIECTREISQSHPDVGIVMVTMFEDDDSVFAAMRAGARGYVLKGDDPGDMLAVIRAVAAGEAHFGPNIARRLMGFFAAPPPPSPEIPFPELTGREREVLHLIASGNTNQQIASQLYLSPKTIRNHISNIFAKMQVADRAQAIIRARDAGLG